MWKNWVGSGTQGVHAKAGGGARDFAVACDLHFRRLAPMMSSLEPEENDAVVAAVPPELIVETMRRLPGRDAGDGFYAAVIKSEQPAND